MKASKVKINIPARAYIAQHAAHLLPRAYGASDSIGIVASNIRKKNNQASEIGVRQIIIMKNSAHRASTLGNIARASLASYFRVHRCGRARNISCNIIAARSSRLALAHASVRVIASNRTCRLTRFAPLCCASARGLLLVIFAAHASASYAMPLCLLITVASFHAACTRTSLAATSACRTSLCLARRAASRCTPHLLPSK